MGIISSLLSYYMATDNDPDPVTGLTSRDRFLVQSSWLPVRKDLTGNGVALLYLYFEKYPEAQQYFPFKDIPKEELKTNKKFQAHCSSVMYSFDSLVDNLADSELLVNILQKLGKNHKKRNIKAVSFSNLKATILELFGTFMSKEALAAWEKTLGVAFTVIDKEL